MGGGFCSGVTEEGEITGPKTGMDRISYIDCFLGPTRCVSGGPPEGTESSEGNIVTNLLDTRLLSYPETVTFLNGATGKEETTGPSGSEVWEQFTSAEHEPYLFNVNCAGEYWRDTGQYTAVLKAPNVLSRSQVFAFGNERGAYGLLTEEYTGSEWSGTSPAVNDGESTISYEDAIEARS